MPASSKVKVGDLRRYRTLFEQASDARNDAELAAVAVKVEKLDHWLLEATLKDKLVERARALGIPCRRDPDLCLKYLITRPQKALFEGPLPLVPPKAAQVEAKRGLAARKRAVPDKRVDVNEAKRGRDIVEGHTVDARQAKTFFDEHQEMYTRARDRGLRPKESPVIQAWLLWGGDPMRRAAERALAEASAA